MPAPLTDVASRQELALKRTGRTKSVDISRFSSFNDASLSSKTMSKRASVDFGGSGRPIVASGSTTNTYSPTFLRSPTIDFARPIVGQRQALPTPEELVQERAFRKWLNARLETNGFEPMANLATDLSDGVNLLRLLEIMSTESLGRWNHAPRIRVQRAENLDIALKFIAAKGIILTNISAEDILDSNLKLILGLVWTLLFRFSVQTLASDGVNAKDALLLWVQEQIAPYGVDCDDWSRSFSDGRVLCALIHSHKSTAFGWKDVEQLSSEGRVAMAFDVASSAFRVPRSLEVRDLCRTRQDPRPDEKIVMTYVASLYEAFKATQLAETSAECLTAFIEKVDGVWTAQSEYEARATELLGVLANVRSLWSKERPPSSYDEAAKNLALCRDSAARARLRDERRDLSSLYARIVAKLGTYNLAAWQCPAHLIPSALAADVQGFFREEDARRESLARYVLECQAKARGELAKRCQEALDALDGLTQRIDALSLSDLERYIRKLEACKADLAHFEQELETVRAAEAYCEAVGADLLHARLHSLADLTLERETVATMIDQRMAFARTQVASRQKANEMSPEEQERVEHVWRGATGGRERMDRSALATALASSELGLAGEHDLESLYARYASAEGISFNTFLKLCKRLRGSTEVRQALTAITNGDLTLDYSVLPKGTAEKLARYVGKGEGGGVDAESVVRRAYG